MISDDNSEARTYKSKRSSQISKTSSIHSDNLYLTSSKHRNTYKTLKTKAVRHHERPSYIKRCSENTSDYYDEGDNEDDNSDSYGYEGEGEDGESGRSSSAFNENEESAEEDKKDDEEEKEEAKSGEE